LGEQNPAYVRLSFLFFRQFMPRAKTLIIGYGNTLRSDDGVGVRVAETIAQENHPNIRVLTVQQLTPELAEDIANSQGVIFIDATLAQSTVTVKPLSPNLETNWSRHQTNPEALLFLAQTIYGKTPPAWWVLIPGINFEFGENLAPITEEHQKTALGLIYRFLSL